MFGIPDPNLPIHYTTFMGQAMMKIKGSLLMSILILSSFGGKIWLGHVTCKVFKAPVSVPGHIGMM